MRRTLHRLVALGAVASLAATPALAHHRQTPPVVPLTTSGDTALPRQPAAGRSTITLATPQGADTPIVTVKPYKTPSVQTPLATAGDNQNPAISYTGNVVAWDTDADPLQIGLPGRQIVVAQSGFLIAGPTDPTGTSTNPSVDATGGRIIFESTGDLANTGNAGARQVFLRQPTGGVSQASIGVGTSRNPVLAARKGRLAFESTSDPGDGHDTGVEQIWLGTVTGGPAAPITDGLAPSTVPSFSDDGGVLVFQSRANLATDKTDTGVPQVFAYDPKSSTTAQLTFDAGGCSDPAVTKVNRDWRIGFVCDGQPYYFMLREDQRYAIPTPGGSTSRLLPELGKHFVVLATTFDFINGTGTTAGHQVYMLNLFKQPATAVPGPAAVWFPFQGIHPL